MLTIAQSKETIIRFLSGAYDRTRSSLFGMELMDVAVRGDTAAAIQRLEKTLIWRRTENIDDLEAMAADCEPEVSVCLAVPDPRRIPSS